MTVQDAIELITRAQGITEAQLRALGARDVSQVAETTARMQDAIAALGSLSDQPWTPDERQQLAGRLIQWRPRLGLLLQQLQTETAWYRALGLPTHSLADSW